MALKKTISPEKYLYARVKRLNYEKGMCFGAFIHVEHRDAQTDEVGLVEEYFFTPPQIPEIEALFSVEHMSGESENVLKSAYVYLKQHNSVFLGWEDC